MKSPIFPCLWLDDNAKEAADFYCSVFPNSRILEENPLVIIFELNGSKFMTLNDNKELKFNDSMSFVINCETQEEIDYYWEKLTDGGEESMCGWLKDKFGVSWQVVPWNIGELLSDPARSERIMNAVLKMRKLDMNIINNA
jgi:predicted 3-demethylubiquinone-9 3-methyltransferase (glyoxalase superfamily)